jgi:hypothetical protein
MRLPLKNTSAPTVLLSNKQQKRNRGQMAFPHPEMMQVNAGYCYDAGLTPPASRKPCNTAPCPASITTWAVQLWSACVPRYALLVTTSATVPHRPYFSALRTTNAQCQAVRVIDDACRHVRSCACFVPTAAVAMAPGRVVRAP